MALGHHAVLAAVSRRYPPPMDRYLRVTHPSATDRGCPLPVRLACVKHAASVRSEPGSNSQVHLKPTQVSPHQPKTNKARNPFSSKRLSTHKKDTSTNTPIKPVPDQYPGPNPSPYHSIPHRTEPQGAANVSLPIPDITVNEQPRRRGRLRSGVCRVVGGGFYSAAPQVSTP